MSDKLESIFKASPPDQFQGQHAKSKARLSWLVPAGLFFGFLLLFILLFGERLFPAQAVQVATVVTQRAEFSAPKSTETGTIPESDFGAPTRFQASGWFEPYPQVTKVSALVSGVVDEVFVLEGESVRRGARIATLIREDAELDLQTAEANRSIAEARERAQASAIEVAQAEMKALVARIEAAEAIRDFQDETVRSLEDAGLDAIARLDLTESRQRLSALEADLNALKAETVRVEARIEQLRSEKAVAAASLRYAETDLARQKLAYTRTQIVAPLNGRVMRLFVVPGQQRMLGSENRDSAAIASLYDPLQMQARIDVPLAEASQVQVNQLVRLRSNFLNDKIFKGRVIRISGEADLQRNTLQVKVKILNPDDRLRPEMLCRAEFLADRENPNTAASSSIRGREAASAVRLLAPNAALIRVDGSSAHVWTLDESGKRVRLQQILLSGEQEGEFREVRSGLNPGDRVVLNPPNNLQEGQRVRELANFN